MDLECVGSMEQTYSRLASVITDGVRNGKGQTMHSNDEMVYLRDVVETLIYMTDEDSDGVEEVMQLPIIKTKEVKYFDEDEKVWKIGSVIVE